MSQVPNVSLSVDSLAVVRGGRRLFADLSFALCGGELALVTGANGSGKTTLLRTLAGLQPPDSGRVTVDGRAVGRAARDAVPPLAFQGHLDGLNKDLTVAENMSFYARLWDAGALELDALARELRLEDCLGRRVRHLSAGQRRRAALACLRARPATLWLLDEPLTNLDGLGAELVTSWLDAHLDAGGAAVVATHQAERLERRAALAVEL